MFIKTLFNQETSKLFNKILLNHERSKLLIETLFNQESSKLFNKILLNHERSKILIETPKPLYYEI